MPDDITPEPRRLSFAAIGASEDGITNHMDELMVDFGRDSMGPDLRAALPLVARGRVEIGQLGNYEFDDLYDAQGRRVATVYHPEFTAFILRALGEHLSWLAVRDDACHLDGGCFVPNDCVDRCKGTGRNG